MSDKKILVGDMRRETAIGILKLMLEDMEVYDSIAPTSQRRNAVQMAIASLETDEAYQLEYERTTKNDLGVDCNNCKNNLHRGDGTSYCATGDGMCHYECEETTKNDLGVDCISRAEVTELLRQYYHSKSFTDEQKKVIYELSKDLQYFIHSVEATPQEPRKGKWLRMSDLSEQEDDRYKCSCCGNVVHYTNKINLYTFNNWCGRCGSDNGIHIHCEVEE